MRTHGESKTRLHNIWSHMKRRCKNPKNHAYPRYGGRGIKVCDEWNESYIAFSKWARKNGYSDLLSIDRINNDGDYEPKNCRWTTCTEQGKNTRVNILYKGEVAKDASIRLGGNVHLVASRIGLGWSKEKAFTTPT